MTPQPVRLYDFPFSGNGYKARLAMAQLGITVDYEVVDLLAGDTRRPQFRIKNPMGQIPALELTDGTVLVESNAILWWLCESTRLLPDEPMGRAQVVRWMCFEQSNIDKVLGRARFLRAYPDFRVTTPAEFEGWWADGHAALGVLDQALEGRTFLVGDRYSAADICLYGYVHTGHEGGFDMARFPAVGRWLERVRSQPGHVAQ